MSTAESTALCGCGCGMPAPIAKNTDHRHGHVVGQPVRFIAGHNRRGHRKQEYVVDEHGCWIWQLYCDPLGYGRVTRDGRRILAHRYMYELHRGAIPEGLDLDHLCRVPSCVNPAHLEPVSAAENVRRGLATFLTPEAVAEIRASDEHRSVLAARYGLTPGTVSNIRAGIGWADVPGTSRGPKRKSGPVPREAILSMRAQGMLNRDIAAALGRSVNAIAHAVWEMRRAGVEVAPSAYPSAASRTGRSAV